LLGRPVRVRRVQQRSARDLGNLGRWRKVVMDIDPAGSSREAAGWPALLVAASPSDARVAVRNFRRSRSVMCHPLAEKRPIGRTDRVLRSIAGCKRTSRWSVDPAAADNAIIVVKDDRLAWRDG
jgi:hypothetical protein